MESALDSIGKLWILRSNTNHSQHHCAYYAKEILLENVLQAVGLHKPRSQHWLLILENSICYQSCWNTGNWDPTCLPQYQYHVSVEATTEAAQGRVWGLWATVVLTTPEAACSVRHHRHCDGWHSVWLVYSTTTHYAHQGVTCLREGGRKRGREG